MDAVKFMDYLSQTDKQVKFTIGNITIPENYHISELKNASYQSVDCGKVFHEWQETVLHIFLPPGEDQHQSNMDTRKLLSLFKKCNSSLKFNASSRLIIEYSLESQGALSLYQIGRAVEYEDSLNIELIPKVAECKPLTEGTCSTSYGAP